MGRQRESSMKTANPTAASFTNCCGDAPALRGGVACRPRRSWRAESGEQSCAPGYVDRQSNDGRLRITQSVLLACADTIDAAATPPTPTTGASTGDAHETPIARPTNCVDARTAIQAAPATHEGATCGSSCANTCRSASHALEFLQAFVCFWRTFVPLRQQRRDIGEAQGFLLGVHKQGALVWGYFQPHPLDRLTYSMT